MGREGKSQKREAALLSYSRQSHALHISSLPAARRLNQGRDNMQMNEEKA